MKKRMACLMGIAFLIAVSLFSACSRTSGDTAKAKAGGERSVPVTVADAVQKEIPIEIRTFGNVQAHASVQIKSEVDGVLARVYFRKGQNIRRGDLLFSIDSRSYQAALSQAKANLMRDKAQEENALVNAQRSQELLRRGLISRSDNDKAQADSSAMSATVRADRAAIASAQLQVERCSIRSPISGKAGDLLTTEGTLIKANDVPMVTINQIQPIEVFFSVPQADLPAIRSAMAKGILKVKAGQPRDSSPPEEGELFFVDNAIDKGTGTVRLAGIFCNDREALWPGQYVRVTLVLGIRKNAVVVPAVSVQTGQEGKFVFVVKTDNTVEVRPVEVEMTAGAETVIEKGLHAGERVVTDGQLGLVPGARIKIRTVGEETGKTPGGPS